MPGPSLSHLAIFNPTLPPPPSIASRDDRDLEDDLAQAAQIVFYTSRDGGHVSRDRMLRQVGLVKGLMSFSDMLVKPTEADPPWWSVRSHRSRLIVYSPETDWYIYANIALATATPVAGPSGTSKQRGEPVPSAQGLSDRMLVDLLQRGYEDFRLLHGPLNSAIASGSSTLEKFWTRFSFTFEQALSSDPLSTWVDGPSPPSFPAAVQSALDDLLPSPQYDGGIISPSGPLILPSNVDPALVRHVLHLLRASLPPPVEAKDPRRDLGKGERRKTSWATFSSAATSWVPALPTIPLPGIPRSGTPPVTTAATAARPSSPAAARIEGKEAKIRWPSLGLGGLGDAVGSVGTVFGLGGSSSAPASPRKPLDPSATASTSEPEIQEGDIAAAAAQPGQPSDIASLDDGGRKEELEYPLVRTSVEVDQLDVSTLRAAVESPGDGPTAWETRRIYLESGAGYAEHTLAWIIRDDHLLFLVTEIAEPALPPASNTNHLFAAIASTTPHPSVESPSVKPDSVVLCTEHGVEHNGPPMDIQNSKALAELKDLMESACGIKEIYARLPSGKYVAAKDLAAGEVYMGVGKKDASLPEAEHAMRAVLRSHPTLAG